MIKQLKNLFYRPVKTPADSAYKPLGSEIYEAYNNFRPEGKKELFCYVPFSNMSFSFEGRVLACAYNQKVELGHYPENSIRDMWFKSQEGEALRDHMRHNDLSYGCKHCRYFAENHKFSGLKPLVFDKYSNIETVNYPKVMEFELSSTCNLECVMCNGKVSSSIRKNRDKLPAIKNYYDDAFVEQLREFIPHLKEAKFYGGEPLLIPIYFKIWDLMLEINPKIKIFSITNGTTLNERIKKLLMKGDFDIAVSMDSTNRVQLEKIRKNVRKDVLLENIEWFNQYCAQKGKKLVISFTMMRINWEEFPKMVSFCNKIDAAMYVSYLKTPPRFAIWNLPAEEILKIYDQLKDLDFPKGNYVLDNNRQCFQDFLTYLRNAAETNRTRPKEEIIPWAKNKEIDWRYGMAKTPSEKIANEGAEIEEQLPENSEPEQEEMTPKTPGSFDPYVDYISLFHERLDAFDGSLQHADKQQFKDSRIRFFKKVDAALLKINTESEKNYIFYSMQSPPISELFASVEKYSVEELNDQIRSLLSAFDPVS